jgi:CRP-like cAMP-binding protein
MFTTIEKVIFLQNIDIFSDVPSDQLASLATISEEISKSKDDLIFREGDPPDALYFILEGEVRMHRDDQEITVLASKEAFGTWALFDDEPRVAQATAVVDTKLLRIDREDFYDLLADNVEVTRSVLKTMARRLHGLLGRIEIEPRAGQGE